MKIQLLYPHSKAPERTTEGASGYDCFVALQPGVKIDLYPGQYQKFSLGFKTQIPEQSGMLLIPRSGLGSKKGLVNRNLVGLIDMDYRGEVFAVMINMGEDPITIENEFRICQMVLVPVLTPVLEVVEELESSGRGENGFGSTGE